MNTRLMRLKMMVAVAMVACIGMLAACSTSSGGVVKPVPLNAVQIASITCPQLNLLHDQFDAMNKALEAAPNTANVGKQGAAVLAQVDPIAHAVCAGAVANPNVSLANLQSLITTGLPALGNLARTLPMTPQQQAAVQGGLAVSETLVALVNALQSQAPPAGASTAVAPAHAASAG